MLNHVNVEPSVETLRSDVQVCAHGSAAGNVGIVLKQLKALGVLNWNEIRSLREFLVGHCHTVALIT